jgi:hypothetical protein
MQKALDAAIISLNIMTSTDASAQLISQEMLDLMVPYTRLLLRLHILHAIMFPQSKLLKQVLVQELLPVHIPLFFSSHSAPQRNTIAFPILTSQLYDDSFRSKTSQVLWLVKCSARSPLCPHPFTSSPLHRTSGEIACLPLATIVYRFP